MVKDNVKKQARFNRNSFDKMMELFGRKDIILYQKNETKDAQGNVTALTWTESTITGDLQYGPELDKALVNAGWIQEGQAMFYCNYGYDIDEEDYIKVGSNNWTFTKKFRNPRLGASVIHQEWVLNRRANE